MPRIPFIFPDKGLNDTVNYPQQSPDSSSDLENVRVYDPIDRRKRGGSRAGLSKWYVPLINGDVRIQSLIKAVTAQAIGGVGQGYRLMFCAGPAGGFGGTHTNGVTIYDKDFELVLHIPDDLPGSIIQSPAGNYYLSGFLTGPKALRKFTSAGAEVWNHTTLGGLSQLAFDTPASMLLVRDAGDSSVVYGNQDSDGVNQWTFDHGTPVVTQTVGDDNGSFYTASASGNTYDGAGATKSIFKLDAATGALLKSVNIQMDSLSEVILFYDQVTDRLLVGTWKSTTTWDGRVAEPQANFFVLDTDLNIVQTAEIQLIYTGGSIISRHIAVDRDGDIYLISRFENSLRKLDGTTLEVLYVKPIVHEGEVSDDVNAIKYVKGRTRADDRLWFTLSDETVLWAGSGTNGDLGEFDMDGNVVAIHFSNTTGGVSSGNQAQAIFFSPGSSSLSDRQTSLVLVADGDIRMIIKGQRKAMTTSESVLSSAPFVVQAANAYSRVFFVDGTNVKVLSLSTATTVTWTATSAGTLPSLPRLITRWRGRIVLAGLVADPHNWFMSRVGDPFDWDYAPATTDAIQAVAGNIGEVGLMGDIITALCPFDDDTLIIGMDQSIAKISGDPAAGGSIDIITEDTGMAWDAWTLDPNNTLYFMGIDGIYQMGKDSLPVNITMDVLDGVFEAIDFSQKRVVLEWDFRNRGLMVLIADIEKDITNTAYFFEARTGGWFPMTFPVGMGPDILLAYDADESDDKALLLGCRDGFIRKIDADATDDDGTDITSNVRFFPIGTRRGTDSRLYGLEIVLAEGSGDVTLKLYTGQTAEQCATGTEVRWSRLLTAGKNILTLPRLSGAWLQIELAATTRWGLESVFGLFEEQGRSRRIRR